MCVPTLEGHTNKLLEGTSDTGTRAGPFKPYPELSGDTCQTAAEAQAAFLLTGTLR